MKLGIAIAPLNKTNNAKDVLNRRHLLEELLNRRFDFIEGINNPSIMHEIIKHYPCYTLGSLIPRTDIDIVEQFMNACYLAKELDITKILNKYPYQLSGGQKQRVASSRAIITNPKLVLADEPTGALDSKSAKMLLEQFANLNKDNETTILMVTHDAFSASYASRVIFIKDGKIGKEIKKDSKSREEFYQEIIAELGRR